MTDSPARHYRCEDASWNFGRVGETKTFKAIGLDPGSDDLEFRWSFGESETYFNDGRKPDEELSPDGHFPFKASDEASLKLEEAGIFELELQLTDDDGGRTAKKFTVIVVGNSACTYSFGFWKHQFKDNGNLHISRDRLQRYMGFIARASSVFSNYLLRSYVSEGQEIISFSDADKRAKAQAYALIAWLNIAQGSVGWSDYVQIEGNKSERKVSQIMAEIEEILLDPYATQSDFNLVKKYADAISRFDPSKAACAPFKTISPWTWSH
jgi:hypothetical protein